MTITTEELSAVLNDPEVNLLADLFLDFLNPDRSTSGYRRLRNAIIAAPNFSGGMPSVYSALAELENERDADTITKDIYGVLGDKDVASLFDSAYSAGNKPHVDMTATDPDDAILFLSAVFAYIRHTNYNN